MGGASRSEKRRKQEESDRRLAAAGIQPPPKNNGRRSLTVVGGVIAVALLLGLTAWASGWIGGGRVEPTYAATSSGGVITAGNGPVVIDVYEDYICPSCERFEERYGDEITTALNEGKITVRFHSIAILDKMSDPVGYSTRAANAALCAVPAGIFPRFHHRLFDEQLAEGSAGLSDDQLIAFGTELGATGDFAGCVRSLAHEDAVVAETEKALADPALRTKAPNGQQSFGTPTVAVNGQKANLNDTSWLSNAIG
ncbi:MAG: DsbA family protein [Pseudonocardia sp.]